MVIINVKSCRHPHCFRKFHLTFYVWELLGYFSFTANFHSTFDVKVNKKHLLLCHFRVFYDLWNVYRPFQDCHLCNYLQKYEWSQEIINESKLHIWGLYQEHANSSVAKFDISYFILVFHISCKTIKFFLVNEQILLIIHAHIIPFGSRF